MKKCAYCGGEYPDEALVCSTDGERLDGDSVSTVPLRKAVRAGSTLSSMIVWLSCALMVVAMSVVGVFTAFDGLRAGWTYSFGVVLGDNTKVYRSSSPAAYWFMIGLFIITSLVMIVVGPMLAADTIRQYKRTKAQRRKHATITQ